MSTTMMNNVAGPTSFGDSPDELPHVADFRKTGKVRYSLSKALAMSAPMAQKTGLEGEVHEELRRQMGRSSNGIFIPWDAPLPGGRYSVTTTTGAGAVPTILPDTLADALRNKMVCARLGARVGDFRGEKNGMIALPVKSAASTISWTGEGSPPASQSNPMITQAPGSVHAASAYTDATRTMLFEGTSSFRDFIVDDLVGGVAHAVDTAALNGVGSGGVPLGLCQVPNWPTFQFSSGIPTYKGLTAMKRIAGQNNADSAPDARMGWASSNEGREALEQTDMGGGTPTGRFAWKSHACRNPVTGELESIEEMLGAPAAASESIPSGFAGESLSNLTMVVYGNWRHMLIQLFGPLEVTENPHLLPLQGIVRFSVFQGVDVLFMYPGSSFVTAAIVAPNP